MIIPNKAAVQWWRSDKLATGLASQQFGWNEFTHYC